MSGRLRQFQDLTRPDHSRITDDLPVVLIDQPPLFAVAVGLLRDGEETVPFADLVLAAGSSFGCRRLFFRAGIGRKGISLAVFRRRGGFLAAFRRRGAFAAAGRGGFFRFRGFDVRSEIPLRSPRSSPHIPR